MQPRAFCPRLVLFLELAWKTRVLTPRPCLIKLQSHSFMAGNHSGSLRAVLAAKAFLAFSNREFSAWGQHFSVVIKQLTARSVVPKAFAFCSSLRSTLCPSKALTVNISAGPGRRWFSPVRDGVSPAWEPGLGCLQWDLAGRREIWADQAKKLSSKKLPRVHGYCHGRFAQKAPSLPSSTDSVGGKESDS